LAPAWCELLADRREERRPAAVRVAPVRDDIHGTRYGRAALAGVLRDLAGTAPGRRNRATYAAARRVLDLHHGGHLPDADVALAPVADMALRSGLPPREVETTLASAFAGTHGGTTDEHRHHARTIMGTPQEVAHAGA